MTLNCDEPNLVSVVKVEAEQFEDNIIKEKPDQISNCFVYVFDVLKPDIELRRLDAKTIARWTKVKENRNYLLKPKGNQNQITEAKISSDHFFCDFCPKWFSLKFNLTIHKRKHLFSLYCDFCSERFSCKSVLKNHMKRHRSKKCDVCGFDRKIIGNSSDLSNRLEKVKPCHGCNKQIINKYLEVYALPDNKKKGTCPICGLTTTFSYLEKHIRTHERFRCRECSKVLKSQDELRAHLSTVHYDGKGHECFCGAIYPTLNGLKAHQRNIHFTRKCSCEICGMHFESYNFKISHWKRNHLQTYGNYGQWKRHYGNVLIALKNGGPYICDLCGKVYKCRETIAAHFSYIHGPRKIFSCDQCPKTYTAYSALSSHKKFSHKEYEPFVCDICGRKTKTKAEARSHVFTHQSKSKCRICHKFVANLMGHMWTHKKKKISCTICGEMIVKKCMEQHIKARHVEKPKPFKCEQCDEAFLRKRDLVKHKKEKHGFKLFRCHCSYRIDCPKRFREHKKLHKKGTSTYVCSVCGLELNHISGIRKHWKKVHLKSLGPKIFSIRGSKFEIMDIPK